MAYNSSWDNEPKPTGAFTVVVFLTIVLTAVGGFLLYTRVFPPSAGEHPSVKVMAVPVVFLGLGLFYALRWFFEKILRLPFYK